MSFGRTGFGQFGAQSSVSGWNTQNTGPRFGVQPSFTTGSSSFAWGSSFNASSGGFYNAQSSTGWFQSAPSTGGGFFNTGGAIPAGSTLWQNTGFNTGMQQTGQQFANPFGAQQQQQQPPPQQPMMAALSSQNPFRDQFTAAVVRRDRRALSNVTKLAELEDSGQRAIKLVLDEVENYERLKMEFGKEPWFKKETKIIDVENAFQNRLRSISEGLELYKANVEEVGQTVSSKKKGVDQMSNALREAYQIKEELDELKKGGFGLNRPLMGNGVGVRSEFESPNQFVLDAVKHLAKRCDNIMGIIEDLEKAMEGAETEEQEDVDHKEKHQLIKLVDEISIELEKAVDAHKRQYLETLQRAGDMSDPFAIAEKETIEEKEHAKPYILQPRFLQSSFLQPLPLQAPPVGAPGISPPSSSHTPWQSTALTVPNTWSSGLFGNTGNMFGSSSTSASLGFSQMTAPSSVSGFGNTGNATGGGFRSNFFSTGSTTGQSPFARNYTSSV